MFCTLRQGMHKEHQRQGFRNCTHAPALFTRGRNLFSDQGVQMDIYFIFLLNFKILIVISLAAGRQRRWDCKLRGMTLSMHLPLFRSDGFHFFLIFFFNRKTPFFILSFRQVHWVHCISTEAKDMVLFTLPQKVSINCFQMLAAMWNPA